MSFVVGGGWAIKTRIQAGNLVVHWRHFGHLAAVCFDLEPTTLGDVRVVPQQAK